jgi:hypothetical protein
MRVGDIALLPGERQVWSGSPKRRHFFRQEDVLVLPIVAFWLLGLILLVLGNTPPGKAGIIAAFRVVWTLGFCFFAFGLPLLRYRKLGGTTYLVTDRRVVVRTPFMGGTERSRYLTELSPPVVRPADDGTGTITFGPLSHGALLLAVYGVRVRYQPTPPPIVLLDIEDPERVRDLITTSTEATRPPLSDP